jgi:serine/threonine protein kinase
MWLLANYYRKPCRGRKPALGPCVVTTHLVKSVGLAYGDIRPSNLLLVEDYLKLADFDCAARIGAQELEAGALLYVRV